MIAFVSGRVAATGPDAAVVDIGGVGLSVQCTPATLAGLRVGEEARVATSLVVREDSLTLFGFADDDERTVFELLQTASGVGPRLALAMLAVHSPDALRHAVATEDLTALIRVPGIGKKGAQRIVLELKDRLGAPSGAPADVPRPAAAVAWRDQVQAGLVNLGWSARDAEGAVDAVAADLAAGPDGEAPPVAVLLKAALKKLSRP
ncbi:Holliday junction branch migration protein RuvA [Actinomadura craniellae]|uniref:Holliday junction branch migration complex subunit RuvA n=1 Tax=Actinomadura craniellae TaxID=2231787 RepID=A0A365HDV8_9ACTN|nr:Holliday junction branch migration protein RuvA [Actinomadura craniellae]RAY17212.1 Holliday junction branch migration protein RuvA [Actinomadura craniellae]